MNEAVTGLGLMRGRRGLIMGVANERSIAWSIAAAIAKEGGELAFTYQNDSIAKRVRPLATSIGSDFVLQCDVGNDEDLDSVFQEIKKSGGLWILWSMRLHIRIRRSLKDVTQILLEKISKIQWISRAFRPPM